MKHSFTFVGGFIGLLVFLVVGLLPALVYGGYAGVVLASGIFGTPIHTSLLAQLTVVSMAMMSTLATASIFTVAGAVVATGVSALVGVMNVNRR